MGVPVYQIFMSYFIKIIIYMYIQVIMLNYIFKISGYFKVSIKEK